MAPDERVRSDHAVVAHGRIVGKSSPGAEKAARAQRCPSQNTRSSADECGFADVPVNTHESIARNQGPITYYRICTYVDEAADIHAPTECRASGDLRSLMNGTDQAGTSVRQDAVQLPSMDVVADADMPCVIEHESSITHDLESVEHGIARDNFTNGPGIVQIARDSARIHQAENIGSGTSVSASADDDDGLGHGRARRTTMPLLESAARPAGRVRTPHSAASAPESHQNGGDSTDCAVRLYQSMAIRPRCPLLPTRRSPTIQAHRALPIRGAGTRDQPVTNAPSCAI
jgi:hypothetical protein